MPGGNQRSGGWTSTRRRACATGVLAAALAIATATPARAQSVLPDTGAVFAIAQDVIRSATTSVGGIAAPVTATLPPGVVNVLDTVIPSPAAASPSSVPSDASTTAIDARPAAAPPVRAGRLAPVSGTNAVVELARASTALLLLALAAAAFLGFEAVVARRNPRLTAAPVDRRDAELEFT